MGMRPNARILVADDDPEMLAMVSQALELWGARVVRAESGAQLIDCLAHRGPFDLIVTDISMPWMSGIHAMYSARSAGLRTPIVIITALEEAKIPVQVRGLGQNAVLLHKPFELGELERVVSRFLGDDQPTAAPPR